MYVNVDASDVVVYVIVDVGIIGVGSVGSNGV